MSLDKILELDEHFRGTSGLEPTVQLIDFNSKTSSIAEEWSRSITPKDGKTYILVLAMGASEFYGPNRNGDAFRESELKKTYKTFETDAHVYKSHVNKDPLKSYGRVVKAFYNDQMHRIELVLEIDNYKAPDIVDKVNSGESVAVSMGCKIKFDVCSICGNEAPTRAQYCSHLKNELNKIYPDGRIVCADNPNPKFFDISIVWRPADKTGYMLKKVAYTRDVGSSSAWLAEKNAARIALAAYLSKAADIEKLVSGQGIKAPVGSTSSISSDHSLTKQWLKTVVPKLSKSFVEISDGDKLELSKHSLPKTLSSLSNMGLFLATPEFLDLVYIKLTGAKAPEGLATKLVELQGDIFSLLAKNPELAEDLIYQGVSPTGSEEPDEDIQDKMAKYIPYRSLDEAWLYSEQRSMFKQSALDITKDRYLPRNSVGNHFVTKIASYAYSGYIASLLDQDDNTQYTKLASLRGELSSGVRKVTSRPWVVPTILAINRTI